MIIAIVPGTILILFMTVTTTLMLIFFIRRMCDG